MRFLTSSVSAIWILLEFLQTAVAVHDPGYDCNDLPSGSTFIPESRLTEIIKEYKMAFKLRYVDETSSRRTNNFYGGPPFHHVLLLWPVSPTTKNYDEAARTPFNVVIDDDNDQVVSVIIKFGTFVKECKLRENLAVESSTDDFDCEPGCIYAKDLWHAAAAACPKLQEFRDMKAEVYPLRYRGPSYKNSGKQLYYFPVSSNSGSDTPKGKPESPLTSSELIAIKQVTANFLTLFIDQQSEFGVMNSDCKIVGAVKGIQLGTKNGHYVKCKSRRKQQWKVGRSPCVAIKPKKKGMMS